MMRKITHIALAYLLSIFAFCSEFSANQLAPTIPEEVYAYSRGLDRLMNGAHSDLNLETLLALGRKASDVLVRPEIAGSAYLLERLSEENFQEVVRKMKGFWVNRQEVVYVEPDPRFFLELARTIGDRPSVDFFEACKKTSENAVPIYIQQQTDYNGCIQFGSMSLVASFRTWNTYRQNYPKRYSAEVMKFVRDLEFNLAEGTCACGGREDALREFERFVREFPNTTITKRVHERIDQIRNGTSGIRWQCINR
jgi:hypothetical protein